MNLYIFITLVGMIIIGGIVIWIVKKELKDEREKNPFQYIKQDIEAIRKEVGEGIWRSTENSQKQSQESVRLIREITEELVRVSESQKKVINVTDQLTDLQDIFKNPQQRGVVGEFYLETLLRNVMPPGSYQMQYSFSDGLIVDAVIFIKDKVVPVDSKFSLENYNKIIEAKDPLEKEHFRKSFINDLKTRITETAKYIRPEDGTTNFAFMFIPHEAIYYDLLINKIGAVTENTENLIQRAAGKHKVIIVSPTSFLAYLQTVIQGLKAMQIEESAKEIKKKIEGLQKHLSSYQKTMSSLGKSMTATVNHYNKASHEFRKIDKDLYRINGVSNDPKLKEIPSPEEE
ncbi:MAG: DNA recombination protein RmuC [Candidatus Pacebacteria bacterium]|nr:DNA recombination protein RmuC [Candidatus Paceibacterota bacterium]